MADTSDREWLLLLYFLPSTHGQARVQAWRRLQRVGAVLLKNSAYVLPASPESREDVEWIKKEIVAAGGQAAVVLATAPDAATFDDIVRTFRDARARDFETLSSEASQLLARIPHERAGPGRRKLTQSVRRLRERFEDAVRIDFFGCPEREKTATLLASLDQHTGRKPPVTESTPSLVDRSRYIGRTWLTRPHPGVDRMSSAWLIHRFIDSKARFAFGDPAGQPDAIPFDTFRAEFGHQGSHCTFETLCERFGIADPAVRRIARLVHDLDLKETKYGEAEAPTIGRLVDGLRRAAADDETLLRSGMDMFEALYQSIATDAGSARTAPGNRDRSRGRSRNSSRPRKAKRT